MGLFDRKAKVIEKKAETSKKSPHDVSDLEALRVTDNKHGVGSAEKPKAPVKKKAVPKPRKSLFEVFKGEDSISLIAAITKYNDTDPEVQKRRLTLITNWNELKTLIAQKKKDKLALMGVRTKLITLPINGSLFTGQLSKYNEDLIIRFVGFMDEWVSSIRASKDKNEDIKAEDLSTGDEIFSILNEVKNVHHTTADAAKSGFEEVGKIGKNVAKTGGDLLSRGFKAFQKDVFPVVKDVAKKAATTVKEEAAPVIQDVKKGIKTGIKNLAKEAAKVRAESIMSDIKTLLREIKEELDAPKTGEELNEEDIFDKLDRRFDEILENADLRVEEIKPDLEKIAKEAEELSKKVEERFRPFIEGVIKDVNDILSSLDGEKTTKKDEPPKKEEPPKEPPKQEETAKKDDPPKPEEPKH